MEGGGESEGVEEGEREKGERICVYMSMCSISVSTILG